MEDGPRMIRLTEPTCETQKKPLAASFSLAYLLLLCPSVEFVSRSISLLFLSHCHLCLSPSPIPLSTKTNKQKPLKTEDLRQVKIRTPELNPGLQVVDRDPNTCTIPLSLPECTLPRNWIGSRRDLNSGTPSRIQASQAVS